MPESLVDISSRIGVNGDSALKTGRFYAIYDGYFAEFRDKPIRMLEMGVHTGTSLKVWASYFTRGTIIGLDLERKADFSGYPNIVFEQGDQTDIARLRTIAHGGLDIVLDDCSHIGKNAMTSYTALFPYLNSGGLYVIEDWGTGYLKDWPDGKLPESARPVIAGNRILSHDFGMAGFVKSLVDEAAGDSISFAHFYKQTVILRKA